MLRCAAQGAGLGCSAGHDPKLYQKFYINVCTRHS
nr:MAG TPA: PIH1 DOMAIN-CONTAINING PROTEIN 1, PHOSPHORYLATION [Caudoviricetes sp.]